MTIQNEMTRENAPAVRKKDPDEYHYDGDAIDGDIRHTRNNLT
jgi:hypothetical protein